MKPKRKIFIALVSFIIINILCINMSFALTSLQEKAADLNGDGIIDQKDLELMVEIGYPEKPKQEENNTGKYYDFINLAGGNSNYISINAEGTLGVADELHIAQMDWTYSTTDGIISGNIEASINNPSKITCCATYVSSVIYKAGYFTEEEMNKCAYNSSTGLYNFLNNANWNKIEEYSNLEPGDIVFMRSGSSGSGIGHVQIYAGDNTWYNAGTTLSIQEVSPYYDNSYAPSMFLFAMRAPH